jgi:hypothetical protein
MVWQAEVAHQMALLPLATLAFVRVSGHRRDAAWWWLALAFAISWIADTVADVVPMDARAIGSLVYPVSQSCLIGAVLLPRPRALVMTGVLVLAGIAVVIRHGATGPDVALRSVAWLWVAGIARMGKALPVPLRASLFVYFCLGWIAWLVHVQWLVVGTWYPYQGLRLLGLLFFCWAAIEAGPHLRLMPPTNGG